MNCETQKELEVFDVFVSTSSVVNLKVKAETPEEARRLIADSFGLSDNFESDLTMRRMHCYRRLLAQNSPENTLETLEFDFTSEIHVEPKDNKVADEERHVTLVIREGDEYDTDMDDLCEVSPCCEECRCCDELCMVYAGNFIDRASDAVQAMWLSVSQFVKKHPASCAFIAVGITMKQIFLPTSRNM